MSIWTFKPDGRPVITPNVAGGVFLSMHQQNVGDPLVKTFYGATGLSLRVYQLGAGSFTWIAGIDADANPTLTFSQLSATLNGGSALLLVFAV
ncbi:hypothetical protein OX459_08370 [Janthinobacterium sp. SUN026]|uniref:hypothetical protein n=1 Tax=Janthinobacterium sp. SUN026 TaxID=3002438 RepID=UPI0025B0C1E0|nr:hypothetical protein [Janthinobacterium sp. SUN026]MDN2671403.1 hypothetical protein [Janthinobacterium sp. SUN026]